MDMVDSTAWWTLDRLVAIYFRRCLLTKKTIFLTKHIIQIYLSFPVKYFGESNQYFNISGLNDYTLNQYWPDQVIYLILFLREIRYFLIYFPKSKSYIINTYFFLIKKQLIIIFKYYTKLVYFYKKIIYHPLKMKKL